jgi:hypothetical protein
VVWLSRQLVFLRAYNATIFKTPYFLHFQLQSTKQTISFHAHKFYCTFIMSSQTISKLCILTIIFIFSKRKYNSLQFGSVGNWSSLWPYNTAISKTHFLLQFQHSSAKQIVIFHAHYLFKIKHTNSPSHFHLFKDTKKKYTSSLIYASFQPTKFFRMKFRYQLTLTNVPMFVATFIPNAPLHIF